MKASASQQRLIQAGARGPHLCSFQNPHLGADPAKGQLPAPGWQEGRGCQENIYLETGRPWPNTPGELAHFVLPACYSCAHMIPTEKSLSYPSQLRNERRWMPLSRSGEMENKPGELTARPVLWESVGHARHASVV